MLLWQPYSSCERFLRELCCAEGPLAVSGFPTDQRNGDKEFVIRRAATNRVLNVLRHWVSKHSQVGGRGSFPLSLPPCHQEFSCMPGSSAKVQLRRQFGIEVLMKQRSVDGKEQ